MMKKSMIGISLLIVMLGSGLAIAKPFWAQKDHVSAKFERMLAHLDLDEVQQEQVGLILQAHRDSSAHEDSKDLMKALMKADPDSANFDDFVNDRATQMAAQVKQKIIQQVKLKQAIYQVLDSAQKQELSELIDRKIRKFEKRANKHKH